MEDVPIVNVLILVLLVLHFVLKKDLYVETKGVALIKFVIHALVMAKQAILVLERMLPFPALLVINQQTVTFAHKVALLIISVIVENVFPLIHQHHVQLVQQSSVKQGQYVQLNHVENVLLFRQIHNANLVMQDANLDILVIVMVLVYLQRSVSQQVIVKVVQIVVLDVQLFVNKQWVYVLRMLVRHWFVLG